MSVFLTPSEANERAWFATGWSADATPCGAEDEVLLVIVSPAVEVAVAL